MVDHASTVAGNRTTPVDPQMHTEPPPGGQTLLDTSPHLRPKTGLPFAARLQTFVIALLAVAFFLIAQPWSKSLYQVGLPLLALAAFAQFAFGNIPPNSGAKKSLLLLALTWAIIAVIFVIGVVLAPTLIELGR